MLSGKVGVSEFVFIVVSFRPTTKLSDGATTPTKQHNPKYEYSKRSRRSLKRLVERSRSAAVLTKLPRLRTSHAGGRYLHWPLARIFTGC